MKKIFSIFFFSFLGYMCLAQPPIVINITSTPSCTNNGTASAIVSGGVPPYSYEWTRSGGSFTTQYTPSITNLEPGYYSVKVTDAASNIEYGYNYIMGMFEIYVETTPDTCLSGTGTADVTITTPASVLPTTYLWSNNETTKTITNLSTGYYTVTVTDGNGCYVISGLDSIGIMGSYGFVGSAANYSVSINTTNANCLDGTASAIVSGGQAPYAFQWNTTPVQTGSSAIGLHAGTYYSLLTTDATGCESTTNFIVPTNSNLSAGSNILPDTCGAGHGSITVYGIAGQPPYSYMWNTGETTGTITGLSSPSYHSCTITDANGCFTTTYISLNNYSPLFAFSNVTNSSCTSPTGSIALNMTGGTAPYSYVWQTVPVQTSATAVNLGPGNYEVVITDQNGCTTYRNIPVPDNSTLAVSSTKTDDLCSTSTGTATISITGGQSPYSIQWDTNPVQNTLTATGLKYGKYTATVTDNLGCVRKPNVYIGDYSPVNLSSAITNASCYFIADGEASIFPSGGTAPYSYSWSSGAITQTATNLLKGNYNVEVIDATGCRASSLINVGYNSVLPCAIEITGQVFADMDLDCINAFPDFGANQVWVNCNPGGGYQYSNQNGNYDFIQPAPGNFDLDITMPFWFDWACTSRPLNINVPALGTQAVQDIAIQGNALDLTIYSNSWNRPVPGFIYHQRLAYRNQGSLGSGIGEVTVYYDSTLIFSSSNPPATSLNTTTHEAKFAFNNVNPTQPFQYIDIDYQVPPTEIIGTQLAFYDTITNVLNNDTIKLNNYFTLRDEVVGPYDPNDLQVYPKGNGTPGFIENADSVLIYTVRFQNTGNYPAQNVIVKVQTDPDHDLNTFNFMGASALCTITADETGLITFVFEGINLSDSILNEPASHGFLSFSLKQKPGLPFGTEFYCNADIYFDYNSPVSTNTTLNTLTGISSLQIPNSGIHLYPNPGSSEVWIKSSTTDFIKEYAIFDVTSKLISRKNVESERSDLQRIDFQTMKLNPGIYFIEITTNNKDQMLKFILQ